MASHKEIPHFKIYSINFRGLVDEKRRVKAHTPAMPQSLHNRSTITPQSLHSHSTVTPQSHHSHSTATPRPLHPPQSLHNHSTVTPQSLHTPHFTLHTPHPLHTPHSTLHNQSTVTPQSLHGHSTLHTPHWHPLRTPQLSINKIFNFYVKLLGFKGQNVSFLCKLISGRKLVKRV
jgi:hypothetical protein